MSKKFLVRRILAVLIVVLPIFFGLITYWNWNSHLLTLEKQSIVQDWIKIEVKPVKCYPHKEIRFEVSMESFQNKSAARLDLAKTAMLVDEVENAYAPKRWKVISSSEYSQKGELVFPIMAKPKKMKLSLFVPDEVILEWDLTL